MSADPTLRLHLFFAKDNDRAVILRQGPSKLFRMILWYRDSDRFEDGQWLKHKVYVDRCSLSPDGKHFLFFALDGKWGSAAKGSYTAISQPPYFTALVLHPQGDTWGGGGAFISNTRYVVDGCDAKNVMDHSTGLKRVQRKEPSPLSLQIPDAEALREAHLQQIANLGYRTEGACLYRRADNSLIRDFTDMSFEPIKAPYDMRSGWHPADRDLT
ncbi:hypothetical protein [Roseovarius sp. 2305UL8-3]|uniref:hypothetical protein n=1 Tax=Roseovarius conchicola TaxID=3121636 RepID=UPI003527DF26